MAKFNLVAHRETVILAIGFAALISVQLTRVAPLLPDEADYLSNVQLLRTFGFGRKYLTGLQGSAGPLYSILQFLFSPFTGLQPPYIRLVNTGFLAGSILCLYQIIQSTGIADKRYSLFVMAIPMTYVIAGLALTEAPAMFFFSASLYLILKNAGQQNPSSWQLAMGGVCMSMAIIGRQPYLLILPALPLLFLVRSDLRQNRWSLLLTLLSSLAIPCYVFYVWKGLVPPIEGQLYKDIEAGGISYRPDFFCLGLFYFTSSLFIIAPNFFAVQLTKKGVLLWILFFVLTITANLLSNMIELLPLQKVTAILFSDAGWRVVFAKICGGVVIGSCAFFLYCLQCNLRTLHWNREALFFAALIVLISVACAKITWGFSSRYAAQGIPPLLLLGAYFYKTSRFNIVLLAAGIAAGLTALISYLTFC